MTIAATRAIDRIAGRAVPLLRDNVDTDLIIPSREIRSVTKSGLAGGLFAGWRYTTDREPDADFVLNQPEYQGAPILLGGANFGCGSSREQAVWALAEDGLFRPALCPILTVDLPAREIRAETGEAWSFAIEDEAAQMLLTGRDEIDHTLAQIDEIAAWQHDDRQARPWVYPNKDAR